LIDEGLVNTIRRGDIVKDQLSIVGILVDHRGRVAPDIQEIITKHGDDIICRMGIPSPSKEDGLITLVFRGERERAVRFQKDVERIPGTEVQIMSFY
jgi:putative iron-only hydrogenase system regulator